jgi:hypothetical protein
MKKKIKECKKEEIKEKTIVQKKNVRNKKKIKKYVKKHA